MSSDQGRGPVFAHATEPVPRLDAFPEQLQPVAERSALEGRGTRVSPYRMAWVVRPSRLVGGTAALASASRRWLREQGFIFAGQRWVRWDAKPEAAD